MKGLKPLKISRPLLKVGDKIHITQYFVGDKDVQYPGFVTSHIFVVSNVRQERTYDVICNPIGDVHNLGSRITDRWKLVKE